MDKLRHMRNHKLHNTFPGRDLFLILAYVNMGFTFWYVGFHLSDLFCFTGTKIYFFNCKLIVGTKIYFLS